MIGKALAEWASALKAEAPAGMVVRSWLFLEGVSSPGAEGGSIDVQFGDKGWTVIAWERGHIEIQTQDPSRVVGRDFEKQFVNEYRFADTADEMLGHVKTSFEGFYGPL